MESYSQLRVIGEGSFGRALLVRCNSSRQDYVLKEVQLSKNPTKLENSRREAVLLCRMKHPHIVAFREAFEADGLLCIVMEYCRGGDLLQRIKQQKPAQFCVDDILRWFAQMCAGAKHIHDKRVLHRDLKSKNIFLTDDGTIKLGDFGSACLLNSSKAFARSYVGTPYYVAPEIWDNKPYNNKSDVWSLGCVLYELCTLRHPFQASSWRSLILKVCRGAYPPLPNHLPYELHYLIKHVFKTNPKDRPSLHTILTSHRVSKLLRSHFPSQVTEEVEDEQRRRRRWNGDEGGKVVNLLREKSLMKTSMFEGDYNLPSHDKMSLNKPLTSGVEISEGRESGHRKQWTTERPDSVLQLLENKSLVSSESLSSTGHTLASSDHGKDDLQRRRWDRDPPERLLSLLEKAQLSRAFSTFLILKGDDPLKGPLSPPQGDDTDGPGAEVTEDGDRLEPRSDDDDTDFEEEAPCDWMDAVENLFAEH